MELQRVNPGVAGSIGVPVRVGRSNASEVAQIAAGAADAKARGDAAIAGAMNKLSGAVENYSQMRAAHSIRESQVEHKRVEADFAADMQQTSTQYGMALDALSPKTRQYFDLPDDEFLRAISRDADNALSDVVQASIASPNEEGSNGIGFRNGRVFEGRIGATLSRGLKAKFLNDQVVARAKYHKDRAVGKAVSNMEAMAEGGETDVAAYKKVAEEQLSPYASKEECAYIVNKCVERGGAVKWNADFSVFAADAQRVWNEKFNEYVTNGYSINEASMLAYKDASDRLKETCGFGYNDSTSPKELVTASLQSGLLQLAMYSKKMAEDTNKGAADNLRAVVSGEDGVELLNINKPLLSLLYGNSNQKISDNEKQSFDAVLASLNFSGNGVDSIANEIREDISLLNMNDEGDRLLLTQYLTIARIMPEHMFADIQKLARDKIMMSGNEKPDMGAIKERVASVFGVEKLSKLSGDDASTAAACIRACSGIPENQWDNLIKSVRASARVASMAKDGENSVASVLSSSWGDKRTTLLLFGKLYGFGVRGGNFEARVAAAEAKGQ